MNLSLILVCLWIVLANVLAIIPSKDNHWGRAYLLVACGIPLLGYVTFQNGPLIGMACLLAGMSLLRWPVRHLFAWMRGLFHTAEKG